MRWLALLLALGAIERCDEPPDDCDDLVESCVPVDLGACLAWVEKQAVKDCGDLTPPQACGCP